MFKIVLLDIQSQLEVFDDGHNHTPCKSHRVNVVRNEVHVKCLNRDIIHA